MYIYELKVKKFKLNFIEIYFLIKFAFYPNFL